MVKFAARIFESERVHVDGQQFIDCEFKNCSMVFSGGALPGFLECHFEGCQWQLEAAASRTVQYLQILNRSGSKNLVDGIIRTIQS
jgi:hypothetical protein